MVSTPWATTPSTLRRTNAAPASTIPSTSASPASAAMPGGRRRRAGRRSPPSSLGGSRRPRRARPAHDPGHDERGAVRTQVRQDATKTSVPHGSPRDEWTTNPTARPAERSPAISLVVCRRWPPGRCERVKEVGRQIPSRLREHNLPLVSAGVAFYAFLAFGAHADHRGRPSTASSPTSRRAEPGARLRGALPGRGGDVHPVAGHADRERPTRPACPSRWSSRSSSRSGARPVAWRHWSPGSAWPATRSRTSTFVTKRREGPASSRSARSSSWPRCCS